MSENENSATARKQMEWQMSKLRDRLDKAMNGYPVQVCLVTLADMFYSAMAATSEHPEQAAHGLIAVMHASRQPKVEPSLIVAP